MDPFEGLGLVCRLPQPEVYGAQGSCSDTIPVPRAILTYHHDGSTEIIKIQCSMKICSKTISLTVAVISGNTTLYLRTLCSRLPMTCMLLMIYSLYIYE